MLQAILNKYLSLSPDIEILLAPLQNKVIAISCDDFPSQNIYANICGKNILLTSSVPTQLDLSISSSLSGFVKFAIDNDRSEIQISGSIGLAENLQKLFANLNIDWEEELSKYSGDIIAHNTLKLFKKFRSYTSDSSNSLQEMLTEYLQEESNLLPTKFEVEQFMRQVDELRFALDRLEARVGEYEAH